MESLQSRFATHFGAIPLFSMRVVSLASCRVVADAWCKWELSASLASVWLRVMGMFQCHGYVTFERKRIFAGTVLKTL